MKLKKSIIAIPILIILILLSSCGSSSNSSDVKSASRQVFAMDTYMKITCYGEKCEEAVAAAVDEINRLDALLSVGNEDSEIAQINKNGEGYVGEEAAEMIEKAIDIWEKTDGAFDITIYPLMVEWGFTTKNFKVPDSETISELLQHVGCDKIYFDKETGYVKLNGAQGIDLGGIAKGYTSDRLMEIFEEYDLVCGLVSLGGNVEAYRKKTDGSLWKVSIADPNSPKSAYLGKLRLSDKAVITSGAYERNFTDSETGKTYHHILDPSTGISAESGLISATIVSSDGTLADALSTATYVMGLDKSIEYWRKYGESDGFGMILMTSDNKVYITEDISDEFTSGYEINVIKAE